MLIEQDLACKHIQTPAMSWSQFITDVTVTPIDEQLSCAQLKLGQADGD